MKLTIIVPDKSVYKNGLSYANLPLSGIPSNVHALQWSDSKGWLEFNDGTPNESITVLPTWANDALLQWEQANTPPVNPTEPTIPTSVSMRQARLALLQQGLLATVNAAIAAGGEADKIAWEYATEVDRSDVLVQNLAAGLGLTSAQLDDLFLLASTL